MDLLSAYVIVYGRSLTILLIIIWISLMIVSAIYSINNERKKNYELNRLKKLNNGLGKLYDAPLKKVKEWIKDKGA